MKIVHITPSYKPAYVYGGPIQSVGKLCEALSGKQNQVEVLTTTANGKQELNVAKAKQQVVNGVQVTYFKRWTKDHSHFSPALLQGLKKLIRQSQQEKIIVHIHSWWNLVSVLSCAIAKIYQIPVVLSPRGMLTSYTQVNRNAIAKKIIHQIIGKKLLSYCHIHATSEQEKQEILAITDPKSMVVIPNLVSLPVASTLTNKLNPDTSLKLIFLSRIEEKKGLELLFDALAMADLPWTLTIAGAGNENYIQTLKQKCHTLQLSHKINWLGQVSNEIKFDLLAAHDVCVLTSYNENFANVIIESLSVGTAVLISEKVGISNYVSDKNLGWVTSLDTKRIADNLKKIFHDESKRDWIGENAPQIIRTDFDDEILLLKYLNLYAELSKNTSEIGTINGNE